MPLPEPNPEIWINSKQLNRFERNFLAKVSRDTSLYSFEDPLFYPSPTASRNDVIQYFLIGNAINFRYWTGYEDTFSYCQGLKGGKLFQGAAYLWRCLKLWVTDIPHVLSADFLATISYNAVQKAFASDLGRDILPDLKQRVMNLNDLGQRLRHIPNKQFATILDQCAIPDLPKISSAKYIQLIRQFRAFDDPMAKLAMVNAITLTGRRVAEFDRIVPAIDYHLPNTLFRIGILECEPHIQHDLELRSPIAPEIAFAIRQAALQAFYHMMKTTQLPGEILDQIFYQNKACREPALCNLCPFAAVCAKNIYYHFMLELHTRWY